MNLKAGLGICVAFVLGAAVGHLERLDFGKAAPHAPPPALRASSVAELRVCDRVGWDQATYSREEATGRSGDTHSKRIEDPALVFTASLTQPDSDTKLATLKSAFT